MASNLGRPVPAGRLFLWPYPVRIRPARQVFCSSKDSQLAYDAIMLRRMASTPPTSIRLRPVIIAYLDDLAAVGPYGKGRAGVMRRFIENGIARAIEKNTIQKKSAGILVRRPMPKMTRKMISGALLASDPKARPAQWYGLAAPIPCGAGCAGKPRRAATVCGQTACHPR